MSTQACVGASTFFCGTLWLRIHAGFDPRGCVAVRSQHRDTDIYSDLQALVVAQALFFQAAEVPG